MSNPDTFLTDERRAVLRGEYEGSENVERTHKSRIRERARSALNELQDVADSPHISNHDVFEPKEVGNLLFYILRDPGHYGPDPGLTEEPPEEVKQYRDAVLAQLFKQIAKYGDFEVGRYDG